ncbi:MAG: AAA family ATPase [Gammaproteobacteria bacterium]|nr:AAA family ATPase [Gammaproteobacteria bacterium]
MRILNIRFKNLNSLVGEWTIDLTHPAYTSNGIFAITGSTGAGKTTILDAICLALYGRTPRLDKITKSENEMMSRQTGECFSEVTFETQSGRFRCHWSQHRARKKPDSDLQAPKHEISDADSGKVFQASLRGVAEQVEATTGMNFERFTRSMLLAQGGFDVFLQAERGDRSPILEQLTGTEIYSQISRSVHERHSVEGKKLKIFRSELDGIPLLSEEEEQQLKANLEQKNLQEVDLNKQIEKKRTAITWLDNIGSFEKALVILDQQKQSLFARQKAFKPKLKKLEHAKQALELAVEYTRLDFLRQEQEMNRQSLSEHRYMVPKKKTEVHQAEEGVKQASEKLSKKKNKQKEVWLVIRNVRELDFKIGEKEASLKKVLNIITASEKTLDTMRTRNNEEGRSLDTKKSVFDSILKSLEKSKADEGLIEHLSGIRSRFDLLRETEDKHRYQLDELDTCEMQKNKALQWWSEQSKILKIDKKKSSDLQENFAQQQIALNQILTGREISDWRNFLSNIKEKKEVLNRVSDSINSLTELKNKLSKLHRQHEIFIVENKSLDLKFQQRTEKKAGLEEEMKQLEARLSRVNKILSFGKHRDQLQDGESCPLCGAKTHPFAEGNTPVPDEITLVLNRVRTDLKKENELTSDLKIKQTEILKDLAQITNKKKEITDNVATEEVRVRGGVGILSIDTSDKKWAKAIPRLQQENDGNLENALKVVQAAEGYEKKMVTMREAMEKARESTVQSERKTQHSIHQKESAEWAVNRAKKEWVVQSKALQKVQNKLLRELSPYGIKNLDLDALDQVLLELTTRRDQRTYQQKRKVEIEKQLSALEFQTQHQSRKIIQIERELKKQGDEHNALLVERDNLTRERQKIFGDKKPDDEESHLSLRIDQCDKHLENSRQRFDIANQKFGKLKNSIEAIEKSMLARAEKLKTEEAAFQIRLGLFGFSTEADYQAARLPENERKNFMQQAEQLTAEQTALDARYQEKITQLKIEQQKQMTNQPHELLGQELSHLANRLKELQQRLGGIQQKLKDNHDLRCQQQERAKAFDAQKREYSLWDTLHELIGSADGKKYRNFAQGLTFEMMIGYANRQLQKMTDRYLLIRCNNQPLELNVVDNYQAGEIRSTKNLSGGESFLVSLSLALGLSHMASKNVRIDSLFLDEGFGTLDEDALDTALEALSGLQEEGKLIGVISHVSTLKERISTQIQVTSHTGGKSVISGPGCGRSAEQ